MEEKIMEQNLGDLGERLHELRRQRGISQEELAGAIGVSRQAVSKWEGCQAQPELDKAVALAEYFDVSLDWLLRGVETGRVIAAPARGAGAAKALPGMLVTMGTALSYIGLLLAWAIWDYWQISLSAAVGAGFMILGVALLAAAVQLGEAEKGVLVRRFWRYNIWPVAYFVIAVTFSLTCMGRIIPILTFHFSRWFFGECLFAAAAWLIICVCTFRWSKK